MGATLAALILIGGYATLIYDNSQLSSLVEKCKTEAAQAPKSRGLTDEEVMAKTSSRGLTDEEVIAKTSSRGLSDEEVIAKAPWLKDALVCDPDILSKLRASDEVGIQKQIIESLSTSGHTFNDAKVVALFIFLLFISPYAWYFLLRRIREVRDAIAGK